MRRQRLFRAVGGVAIVAVISGWIAWRRAQPSPHPVEAVATTDRDVASPPGPPMATSPGAPPPPTAGDPDRPIIDAVTVEKTEVCRGEENFVSIKAHTARGTDAYLVARMMVPGLGQPLIGNRLPFRLAGEPERDLAVTVNGKTTSETMPLPRVTVKDCDEPRQVTIVVGRNPLAPDMVHLAAQLKTLGDERFEPASYEWEFGDGQKLTTVTPEVEHSYEARDQGTAQSSFLVTARITSRTGQSSKGSTSVSFTNLGFAALMVEKRVVISLRVEEANPSTGQHERIWLYHGYPEPVRIDRASITETMSEENTNADRDTWRNEYPPQQLLGFAEIPARRSVLVRDLTSLQPTSPGAVRHVRLEGRTADGKVATAAFTLLPPKVEVQATLEPEPAVE